ncbi:hypothetical protein [Mesorhizobium carmichaelinearum]|uniref:hypothetical protein n=1 Tax=Mesorhizobium carmichaelinearum TaxID=1208188 RepID=UPI001FCED730
MRDVSVADALASGRVVVAINAFVPTPDGYYVVAPVSRPRVPKVEKFRSWVLGEAEATQIFQDRGSRSAINSVDDTVEFWLAEQRD